MSAVLLSYLSERGLALTGLARRRRYRLAFFLGAALSLLICILAIAFFSNRAKESQPAIAAGEWIGVWVAGLLIAGSGAFLGGLWATSRRERLWEDNAPPPKEIQQEVLAFHQRVIGSPGNEAIAKRLFDILLSLFGLVISAPVWLASAFLVWIEDPGPILFVKNSVGRGGVNFHQFKIRSMVLGAEQDTGPVLAQEGDERILWIGQVLRKTALDELPQLLNILRGEMSFVGPRPQRTILVYDYLLTMPEYAERHRVRPGLAGLAQVAGDYYVTPRQKLRFDCLYIRHCSLGFDLKLLFLAFMITFWYRWQKKWDGKLPRQLLHGRR